MNIEVGDLLTLDDKKDYFVVAISNKNNNIYYCLASINDIDFKVFKLNSFGDSLSSDLIVEFASSYKNYLHGVYSKMGVVNG